MKITKRQLKRIIKEEKAKLISEQAGALVSQTSLEALNRALEVVYYEAVETAEGDGYDELSAQDAAMAVLDEEVKGFAESVGHLGHSRG